MTRDRRAGPPEGDPLEGFVPMDLPEGSPDADAPLVGRAHRPSLEGPGPQRVERAAVIGGYLQPNLGGPEPGDEIETATGEDYEPNFMNVPPTFEHAALRGLRSGIDLPTNPKLPIIYRPLQGARPLNRGQSKLIKIATKGGVFTETVFSTIVATPRDGGDDAQQFTVTLGLDYPNDSLLTSAAAGVVDFRARLQWGTGGASYTTELDWFQGHSFGLAASFIQVDLIVGAFSIPAGPEIEFDIQVSASIAEQYGSPVSPARRTIDVGALSVGGSSAIVPIPRWAKNYTFTSLGSLNIFDEPDVGISLCRTMTGVAVATQRVTSRDNTALNLHGQFPIPRTARFFQLVNLSPSVDLAHAAMLFDLEF